MSAPQTQNLVVDIGNTNVVLGVFHDQKLVSRWRINTQRRITLDEVVLTLRGLLASDGGRPPRIDNIAVASVVPNINYPWSRGLEVVLQKKPQLVTSANTPYFKIQYDYPNQIGADRLCNVLGCQALDIHEAIVVDFGTATTFDVYADNTYWGGVICPGMQAALLDLVQQASRLSEVALYWNPTITGKNTDDALRNGVLYGTVGQIEYIIEAIQREIHMVNPVVIGTGGLASLIANKSKILNRIEKDMTLLGLNYFLRQRTSKNGAK